MTMVRFGRNRELLGLAALAFGGWLSITAGGCNSDDASAELLGVSGSTSSTLEEDAFPAGPLAGLTVEAIDERLHMDAAQEAAIGSALEHARAARAHRGGKWGRAGRAERAGDPPMMVFLEDASKTLTSEQFLGLAQMLGEKRDAWIAEHKDRKGPRGEGRRRGAGQEHGLGLGGFGGRIARDLDLTDSQRERIEAIVREGGAAAMALRDGAGSASREEVASRMRELRRETREQIHAILTPEQRAKAEQRLSEVRNQGVERRMERLEERMERRAAFLERVLALRSDQAREVHAILEGTVEQRRAALASIRSGSTEPEDTMLSMRAIEESAAERISALLDTEQRAKWEAIRSLVPGRGPLGGGR